MEELDHLIPKEEKPKDRTLVKIVLCCVAFAFAPTTYLIYVYVYFGGFKGSLPFDIHPFSMIVAIFFFLSLGRFTRNFDSFPGLTSFRLFPFSYKTKKYLHLFLTGVVVLGDVVGLVIIFLYNSRNHYPHLYSFHSWLGITVSGSLLLQVKCIKI